MVWLLEMVHTGHRRGAGGISESGDRVGVENS